MLAVQADPAFATNGYVYLLYTRRGSGPAHGPTTDRLVRVTAQGDTASPASETVVLGKLGDGSCLDLPAGSDCVPADHEHVGGDIAFAKDGTMFVSTGDGGGGPDASDLEGAWNEVPESHVGIIQPGADELRPFTPHR